MVYVSGQDREEGVHCDACRVHRRNSVIASTKGDRAELLKVPVSFPVAKLGELAHCVGPPFIRFTQENGTFSMSDRPYGINWSSALHDTKPIPSLCIRVLKVMHAGKTKRLVCFESSESRSPSHHRQLGALRHIRKKSRPRATGTQQCKLWCIRREPGT